MPPLSTILNGVKLGYAEESLSLQGLGYRNLILLLVLLNSWKEKQHDTVINVLIMEEPEAHLCINNIRLMCSFIGALTKDNNSVQLIFSSHSPEFINKHSLESVVVLDAGKAYALLTELDESERNYLSKNPNTDIYKLFLSHRCILVEGITEELFIKACQTSQNSLVDIDVLSFHKGFTKIIEIWQKTNSNCNKKLGVVRDYDDEPAAQVEHEKYNDCAAVLVTTTKDYTLEPEIVKTGKIYSIDIKDELERFLTELGFLQDGAVKILANPFVVHDECCKASFVSGAFLGGVLLSAITSLPELFTSISATVLIDSPSLCIGNILGSKFFSCKHNANCNK